MRLFQGWGSVTSCSQAGADESKQQMFNGVLGSQIMYAVVSIPCRDKDV